MAEEIVTLPPERDDAAWAEQILDELQKVLQRHGAVLVHKPDAIVVGVPLHARRLSGQFRAIAQVQDIGPILITWRPIEWTKPNPAA